MAMASHTPYSPDLVLVISSFFRKRNLMQDGDVLEIRKQEMTVLHGNPGSQFQQCFQSSQNAETCINLAGENNT
jgi:hypothetical protein